MPMSSYLKNKVLDHTLGLTDYTFDTSVYVALYNGDPLGAGSESETPATHGYNRVELTIDAAAAGATQNDGVITFGPNSDAGAWTVTHFAVLDAATAGNILWAGTITNRTVNQNDSYQIADGDLDFSIT